MINKKHDLSKVVYKAIRKTDGIELEVELEYFYFNGRYIPYYKRVGYPRSCYFSEDIELGKMITCEGNLKAVLGMLRKGAYDARLVIVEEGLNSWYKSAIQSGFPKETIQEMLQKKLDVLDNDYEKGED